MIDHRQKRYFAESIIDLDWLFEKSLDWINDNCQPQDVFEEDALHQWAEDNGYIQDE